jgi:hypothetical protein
LSSAAAAAPAAAPTAAPAVAVGHDLPPGPPEFSRWRGGDLSMGPVGRVLWTVVMVAIGGLCLFSQNPFAIGPWWFIAMPLVLRSVWARKRIT